MGSTSPSVATAETGQSSEHSAQWAVLWSPACKIGLLPQVRTVNLGSANSHLQIIQDDLLHPVLGGNKLRKLDGLLPELQAAKVTDVVSGECQVFCDRDTHTSTGYNAPNISFTHHNMTTVHSDVEHNVQSINIALFGGSG